LTAVARPSDPEHALHAHHTRRPLVVLLFLFSVAAPRARAQSPRIDDVEDSLMHDPSYKVRVDAALILGKLHQERSIPALIVGAKNENPAVRAASVRSLGLIGTPGTRETILAAMHDPVPTVRHMARDAQRTLGASDDATLREPGEPGIRRRAGGRLSIDVRPVGDPRHQADPLLRSHMRDFIVEQLRPLGDISPTEGRGTYAVGGVIKNLSVVHGGADVEVVCSVQLVVMRQPGNALFLMTYGEARVLKPRRRWRPQLQESMELEAVEAAVRGASGDLLSQLSPLLAGR
jgi:HEAT repeats